MTIRSMTKEEILALTPGKRVHLRLNDGRIGSAKVNGKVRTWKRDPSRVEVPLKYGLYEYCTFSLSEALARLVVQEG